MVYDALSGAFLTADEDLYGKGREFPCPAKEAVRRGRLEQNRSCDPFDEVVQEMAQQDAPHRGSPRFYELLREMERIHDAKNSDYADSASDPLRNFRACEAAGISAFDGCLTRLSDKYMRVMNLAKKEREGRERGVKNEAITDTLLDMANYALIALILYEEG